MHPHRIYALGGSSFAAAVTLITVGADVIARTPQSMLTHAMSAACFGTAWWLLTRSDRLFHRAGGYRALDRNRPLVVWLRSFADETLRPPREVPRTGRLQRRQGSRYEEALARLLPRSWLFVTVGVPDEYVPRLGAFRIYVDRDGWPNAVRQLLSRSHLALIVLRSMSEGILYELRLAFQMLAPEKIIVFLPHDSHEHMSAYEQLAATCSGIQLPPPPRAAAFLTFNADGAARLHESGAAALRALDPTYRRPLFAFRVSIVWIGAAVAAMIALFWRFIMHAFARHGWL